jgi:hypothetical protein
MSLVRSTLFLVLVLGLLAASATAARPEQRYTFERVVDSEADGLVPFDFECSAINDRGQIAFRASRVSPDSSRVIQGVFRADDRGRRHGRITTIAEFGGGFDFVGQIPSIDDHGNVAFAARSFDEETFTESQRILVGDGGRLTTVADTADEFSTLGFEPTINDHGVVAFRAQLDTFDTFNLDQGLFSRRDRRDTVTHFLSSTSRLSEFGPLSRPAVNDRGDIAFEAPTDGESTSGIFVAAEGGFRTIAAADPNVIVDRPNLNDRGTVVFHRFFNDRAGEELLRGRSAGSLRVLADTDGPFAAFGFFHGFQAPALNNRDEVAFYADLDDGGGGIFTGHDVEDDVVVSVGDRLDGDEVRRLRICEEGLNDHGQIVFQATFDAPESEWGTRVAIYRATPRR